MDPERLKGKNILVTGAARGMGATNAEHFAGQGANVCLGDVDLDGASEIADRINARGNGKAIALGEPEGMVKTVFDEKTGALLGAHMVGAEVTELIQGYVVGRQLETTEEDLMNTVFPHPTLSEMMHESVLDAWGRAIHY